MLVDQHFVTSNGVRIPQVGLGTLTIADENDARVVREAIQRGYRHIDTAQAYGRPPSSGPVTMLVHDRR